MLVKIHTGDPASRIDPRKENRRLHKVGLLWDKQKNALDRASASERGLKIKYFDNSGKYCGMVLWYGGANTDASAFRPKT